MDLRRFAIGVLAAVLVIIAYTGQDDPPSVSTSPTAPNTVVLTAPSTSTTLSTTTSTTTTIPIALVAPDYVCEEWAPLMLEAGWPADRQILETALSIMWRESRCQPDADSGPDHCLFQINRFWSSEKSNPPNWLAAQGIANTHDELLTDPLKCVQAALAIYKYSLERNGDGFLPWTTYSGRPNT